MPQVLAVDDDRTILRLIEKTFEQSDVAIQLAGSAEEALVSLKKSVPDVLLLDIMLPGGSGLELAAQIKELDARLPIIFMSASEDSDTAISAMSMGAYDFLLKPLDKQSLQETVDRALEVRRLMNEPVHLKQASGPVDQSDVMIGRSSQMLEVYKQIGRIAAQDVTVLIRGESGTGKELIARAVYQHSHRKDECFLAVNCAALSETLLESELFGHEKGAFTGADRRRIGKFEQCNGGTIFLDEVGDMSPATQSKVLRLLQEQRFERVGGTETIATNVRIISATNRDLEKMIEDGEFRLDLFHRLNAFEILLPPLRDRGEDLPRLIEHYLHRFNHLLNKSISGISEEAAHLLTSYRWPGNIRQLQSVIRKAMLMATSPIILPEFLPEEVLSQESVASAASSDAINGHSDAGFERFCQERQSAGSNNLYAEALEWMERRLVTRVLQDCEGNQSKAAEQLGITRGSLRTKIRALGISIGHVVDTGD
ncbi:MAG: sigma-54-dependent transcriptional regulator [Planctomycetaceae bacterium]